jgi:hypothetical protein
VKGKATNKEREAAKLIKRLDWTVSKAQSEERERERENERRLEVSIDLNDCLIEAFRSIEVSKQIESERFEE